MRTPDGRKGKVFSIRLTDDDRALLARVAALEEVQHWGRPRALGELVRASAIVVARRLLCMPMPKEDPHGSYWQRFDDKLELELASSFQLRAPKPKPATPKKTTPARGTTRRRPTKARASRRGTTVRSRATSRGAR